METKDSVLFLLLFKRMIQCCVMLSYGADIFFPVKKGEFVYRATRLFLLTGGTSCISYFFFSQGQGITLACIYRNLDSIK